MGRGRVVVPQFNYIVRRGAEIIGKRERGDVEDLGIEVRAIPGLSHPAGVDLSVGTQGSGARMSTRLPSGLMPREMQVPFGCAQGRLSAPFGCAQGRLSAPFASLSVAQDDNAELSVVVSHPCCARMGHTATPQTKTCLSTPSTWTRRWGPRAVGTPEVKPIFRAD